MLKGRCRDCQAKISKRYPLVELLTALAFLLASLVWPESGWGLAVMILSAWLIAASVIDLDNQWLPDVFTQGVLWTGLIAAWVSRVRSRYKTQLPASWWGLSLFTPCAG